MVFSYFLMAAAYYGSSYGTRGIFSYFDWTWILILAGLALSLLASAFMKSAVARYSNVTAASGLTGKDTACIILRAANVRDVGIGSVQGKLTDHYDPSSKTVGLAEESYGRTSLAAVGIAAHECGHAIQDAESYTPLKVRSAIVPAVNIGSQLYWPIFIVGLIFSFRPLLTAGIILYSLAVLFQLVTLPVEINASSRGLKMLRSTGILRNEEISGARKVLTAAAMTYVAALASSALQLIRMLILAGGNRRD